MRVTSLLPALFTSPTPTLSAPGQDATLCKQRISSEAGSLTVSSVAVWDRRSRLPLGTGRHPGIFFKALTARKAEEVGQKHGNVMVSRLP